jgi:hypothetical protein
MARELREERPGVKVSAADPLARRRERLQRMREVSQTRQRPVKRRGVHPKHPQREKIEKALAARQR